jgi:hypothetical protein
LFAYISYGLWEERTIQLLPQLTSSFEIPATGVVGISFNELSQDQFLALTLPTLLRHQQFMPTDVRDHSEQEAIDRYFSAPTFSCSLFAVLPGK